MSYMSQAHLTNLVIHVAAGSIALAIGFAMLSALMGNVVRVG